jgi:hypothetical protein
MQFYVEVKSHSKIKMVRLIILSSEYLCNSPIEDKRSTAEKTEDIPSFRNKPNTTVKILSGG